MITFHCNGEPITRPEDTAAARLTRAGTLNFKPVKKTGRRFVLKVAVSPAG